MPDPTGIILRYYEDGRVSVVAGSREYELSDHGYTAHLLAGNALFSDELSVFQRIVVRETLSNDVVAVFGTRIEEVA